MIIKKGFEKSKIVGSKGAGRDSRDSSPNGSSEISQPSESKSSAPSVEIDSHRLRSTLNDEVLIGSSRMATTTGHMCTLFECFNIVQVLSGHVFKIALNGEENVFNREHPAMGVRYFNNPTYTKDSMSVLRRYKVLEDEDVVEQHEEYMKIINHALKFQINGNSLSSEILNLVGISTISREVTNRAFFQQRLKGARFEMSVLCEICCEINFYRSNIINSLESMAARLIGSRYNPSFHCYEKIDMFTYLTPTISDGNVEFFSSYGIPWHSINTWVIADQIFNMVGLIRCAPTKVGLPRVFGRLLNSDEKSDYERSLRLPGNLWFRVKFNGEFTSVCLPYSSVRILLRRQEYNLPVHSYYALVCMMMDLRHCLQATRIALRDCVDKSWLSASVWSTSIWDMWIPDSDDECLYQIRFDGYLRKAVASYLMMAYSKVMLPEFYNAYIRLGRQHPSNVVDDYALLDLLVTWHPYFVYAFGHVRNMYDVSPAVLRSPLSEDDVIEYGSEGFINTGVFCYYVSPDTLARFPDGHAYVVEARPFQDFPRVVEDTDNDEVMSGIESIRDRRGLS